MDFRCTRKENTSKEQYSSKLYIVTFGFRCTFDEIPLK